MAKQRLQRILAAAGVASRRKCEQMILDGEIEVNGKVVKTLPVFADPHQDKITVNGQKIRQAKPVYYMLNKPKGVLCTNFDPDGRRLAIDMVDSSQRVHCVGRLDMDSSGLLILTNDNDLTNRLTHPKYEISKTYSVEVKGRISSEMQEKLQKGVWLAEGKTKAASVKVLHRGRDVTRLEITIKQGLNRQIR
ncbi:MAG: pseudouridine synthase, partial [Phycisphaerae bacterium]